MDDIAARLISFDEMIPALQKTFDCLRKLGLELSAHKCKFGATNIHHLGSKSTRKGNSPRNVKIEKFRRRNKMPNTVKQLKHLFDFVCLSKFHS